MVKKQTTVKVSIQGVLGAFHDIAAQQMQGADIEVVECVSFAEVLDSVRSGEATMGCMAIENTIAGSLLHNYHILNESELFITGETYLRIKQNLMALPGVSINDIQEVHSHPIALAQCAAFFENYPDIKLIEASDTALVAKKIKEEQLGIGALASDLAADLYGLEILASSIETNKKNYTRFLKLEREAYDQQFDKVSVTFTVSHDSGSLYKALESLYNNHINLTKIQSVPVMGEPFTYRFFADFMIDSTDIYDRTIIDLSRSTISLKVLGKYKANLNYGD